MKIRSETPYDEAAIRDVTRMAFAKMEHSDGTEPQIIDDLRRNGDLALSLVAVNDAGVVGHVALSPVRLSKSTGQWFGLGPISVHPTHQRKGIGGLMIEEALNWLRSRNAAGCVVLGDPAYYGRFGFLSPGDLTFGTAPTKYVQALAFSAQPAKGEVQYAPAFGG
jgi:predicted N-acetyltransferase YhbS